MYAIDILLTNRSKSNRDNEKIDREIELFWMLKYNHFFLIKTQTQCIYE